MRLPSKLVGLSALVDPLLFVEEQSAWAKFKTVGFKKRGDNLFSAITRLPKQVVSIRLDPVHSAGKFLLSDLKLSRLSRISVLAQLLLDGGSPGIGALIRAMRHGDLDAVAQKHFGFSIADQYARWIAIHEDMSSSSSPSLVERSDVGFVTLLGNENEKTFRETLDSLHKQISAGWKVVFVLDERVSVSLRKAVEREESKDDRVAIVSVSPTASKADRISAGTNALGTKFIGILPAGDCLSPLRN